MTNIDELMEMLAFLHKETEIPKARECYERIIWEYVQERPLYERRKLFIKWENLKNIQLNKQEVTK